MRTHHRPRMALGALLGCVITSSTVATVARAEALPASVRACASETDSLKRLICFDREVARYPDASAGASAPAPAAKAAVATPAIAPPPGAAPPPAVAPPSAAASASAASPTSPPPASLADKQPAHVTAHVASVENRRGSLVLLLDNGQVWEQTQEAAADMNLHAGDAVTIDKGLLGTYWLGGRSDAVIKVKRTK